MTENLSPSVTEEEKFAYIDRAGAVKIQTQFFIGGPFREGLATVYDADLDRWGFIDKEGTIVIKPRFQFAGNFSEGLAVVSI